MRKDILSKRQELMELQQSLAHDEETERLYRKTTEEIREVEDRRKRLEMAIEERQII